MVLALGAQAQQQTNTLLESTFWQGKPEVEAVKAEIAKGADPSQLNANAFDPVVLAINASAPNATVKYLIDQKGNDVSKLTHDGRIYLHWAAYRGNTEIMEYVIGKGSKLSFVDSHGATPLTFAAGAGVTNTAAYDLLASKGVDLKKEVNSEGANVLLLAISNDKDLKLTDYFVSKGLDIKSVDKAGNNAFNYAARGGNVEQMKALVKRGVTVPATAMILAAQSGGARRGGPAVPETVADPLAIYQFLDGAGAKANAVNKTGQNALHYIVRKPNQLAVINYFLAKGADINLADEDGNTPFIIAAASSRDKELIDFLASKVKNINQANKEGLTALTMAARSNTPEMITLLLNKGADAKVLDTKGNNLAYYLIDAYRPPVAGRGGMQAPAGPGPEDVLATKLQLLKDKGLNITAPQAGGNTLFHVAVLKNNVDLLKRIQEMGVDVNAKNKEGITPLHKAAMIAKDDVLLKYLLSIGAKKEVGTSFKETAFDLATENEALTKKQVSVTFLK
ncbi:ankyrin repeat domain-containing protein [Mucilaginibacter myungsuensis]